MNTEPQQWLAAAAADVARFFEPLSPDAKIVVFCHFDADGLAAGALFGRLLPRMGFGRVQVVPSGRGESAYSDEARQRLAALNPDALVVTDLGVHRYGVLPGVPTLYVDHHLPEGEPPGATIVSGYALDPVPCSAWMAYELLRPHTDADNVAWIAAVGTLSDLGTDASWPLLPALKKRYTAKALQEAVALVNAARRASTFDVETPLSLLLEADHPSRIAEEPRLHTYRAEVNAALTEARKLPPVFATGHPFALVRLHSGCQIHPLIAQQWRGRLPKYAVIGANTGFMPGIVAFSTRTARKDLNLPDYFRRVDLGTYNEDFGHGHDQASGGHLPPDVFNYLLDALGFAPAAHVVVPDLPASS